MFDKVLHEADSKMDKTVEAVERDLKTLRTGRATASILDGIMVEAYGTPTPINQVGTVNTPDAATVAVQPWDLGLVKSIEKAILEANIGLTPTNDGKVIRLRVPSLTQETRKEIVKKAHHIAEEGRVAIRNIRRHINDEIKKAEKAHELTEDDCKRHLDMIQKKTDAHIKRVDEIVAKKEAEVMHV